MSSRIENNAYYVIMNVTSRTVIDLDGFTDDGTRIRGRDFDFYSNFSASDSQIWQFQQDGNAWRIVNLASGTCMDLDNGDSSGGTKIQGWSQSDTDNQRWYISSMGDKMQVVRWTFRNKASRTFIDLDGGSNRDGTQIVGYSGPDDDSKNKNPNQQWIVLAVGR